MKGSVSRRYAKALFSLAKEMRVLEPTAEELLRLGAAAANPALAPVLKSPLLSPSRRMELAKTFIGEFKLSDLLTRFVRLLADRQRLAELPGIADYYMQLLDDEKGRLRLGVRTAVQLTDAQLRLLVETFARITGREVISTVTIDPALLGGVVAEVQGKVYDGSVRTQLDRMATGLAGRAVH